MNTPNTLSEAATQMARCYTEFCCNRAILDLTDFGVGASGPFDPAKPVYERRGVWGFCMQHAPRMSAAYLTVRTRNSVYRLTVTDWSSTLECVHGTHEGQSWDVEIGEETREAANLAMRKAPILADERMERRIGRPAKFRVLNSCDEGVLTTSNVQMLTWH